MRVIDPCTGEFDTGIPARLSGCVITSNGSKQVQQSTSNPVVNQPGLDMLNANGSRAADVVANGFNPYGGQLTAGMTPNQQMGTALAPGSLWAGAPQMNAASDTSMGLSGYQAPRAGLATAAPGLMGSTATINPGGLPMLSKPNGLADLGSYMDPYRQNVIDTTMNELNRQNAIAINAGHQNATSEHAFGGDRTAVADSLTNDAYARAKASTLANLNSSAFNTGAGLLQNNQQMGLNAGGQNLNAALSAAGTNVGALNNTGLFNAGNRQSTNLFNAGNANDMSRFNVGSDINSAGVRQTAANSLLGTGTSMSDVFNNAIQQLMGTGQVGQNTGQATLDSLYNEFLRGQQYPFQGQALINQSLGLVPATLGQSSQSTGTQKSSGWGFTVPIPGVSGAGR